MNRVYAEKTLIKVMNHALSWYTYEIGSNLRIQILVGHPNNKLSLGWTTKKRVLRLGPTPWVYHDVLPYF